MELPTDFTAYTRRLMGDARYERFVGAFSQPVPVSIRLNPLKSGGLQPTAASGRVPWCRDGYYLDKRPAFTMDPLLHAGVYYVQEAASMFLWEVLSQHLPDVAPYPAPLSVLDLCAAPGGKATLARAALPEGSTLYANEPVRTRAAVLAENIMKWGYDGCIVTSNSPEDYRQSRLNFDVVLCDVPCSGEGMFRRDAATISQWSRQGVERCQRLQRDIVSCAWDCLADGGLMVYSTCTFNTMENEENADWMLATLDGATLLPVAIQPEWSITGSLLAGFDAPVYRFIPGITRSEGLFMCVLRKGSKPTVAYSNVPPANHRRRERDARAKARGRQRLNVIASTAGKTGEASLPTVALDYRQATSYLRGEALTLPAETTRGTVALTFMGHRIGTAKNIGPRANNLYPKEWRIKTTHTPNDYEAILKHT